MTPDLSVLIVSHGHEAMLPRCIASLGPALAGLDAEILVLDNLGRGGARTVLAGLDATVLDNAYPAGFAANVNRAAAQAGGRHLLVLNPDTEHADGLLAQAIAFLDARPSVGVLGCRLLDLDGAVQQSFRQFPSLPFLLARGLLADRWPWQPAFYRRRMMSGAGTDAPHRADWVFGACMLLRTAQFRGLGGFDPAFRLYYEDVDLCRRYRAAGLDTWVHPGVRFRHLHARASAHAPFSRIWLWHVCSAVRYFIKSVQRRANHGPGSQDRTGNRVLGPPPGRRPRA